MVALGFIGNRKQGKSLYGKEKTKAHHRRHEVGTVEVHRFLFAVPFDLSRNSRCYV
jgi:hypothetical protein